MISFIAYIVLGAILNIFSSELARFMLSGDNAAVFTSDYLKVLGFTLIGVNCVFIFRNAVQGMGCPSIPMISGILEMVLRMTAIFVLTPRFGFIATAFADVIAWIGALAVNLISYFAIISKWRL